MFPPSLERKDEEESLPETEGVRSTTRERVRKAMGNFSNNNCGAEDITQRTPTLSSPGVFSLARCSCESAGTQVVLFSPRPITLYLVGTHSDPLTRHRVIPSNMFHFDD